MNTKRIAAAVLASAALLGAAALGTGGCASSSDEATAKSPSAEWSAKDEKVAKTMASLSPKQFAAVCRSTPTRALLLRNGRRYLGQEIVEMGGSITGTLKALWTLC